MTEPVEDRRVQAQADEPGPTRHSGPDLAAAQALAAHVERWELALGSAPSATADESAGRAGSLAPAVQALLLARGRGHVCLSGSALEPWRAGLETSRLVWRPNASRPMPAGLHPLVLVDDPDRQRLYLHRDHALEVRLAHDLWALAAAGKLRLLSGGPGSGKTTRVAQRLAERRPSDGPLRVALLAPTGKAAARMNESLALAGAAAEAPAQTVHRWLGLSPGLPRSAPAGTKRTSAAAAQAPVDTVIVDEASMLDLELAAALVRAVPADAELWLVGDAGQLAAVEAGAVFAALCAHAWPGPPGHIHEQLHGSHRYPPDSPIARLAAALRGADARAATSAASELMAPPGHEQSLDRALGSVLAPYLAELRDPATTPARLLDSKRGFLVLAARHGGPDGVEALNRRIGRRLCQASGRRVAADSIEPWSGRLLLVLRNDPATGLANGDVGVLWPRGASSTQPGGWDVWFEGPAGPRAIGWERMPSHTDAFAMTVHKAQGSEADAVLVVLPELGAARREWLYTAVTRARQRLVLVGDPAIAGQAALQPAPREGGLMQRLRSAQAQAQTAHVPP